MGLGLLRLADEVDREFCLGLVGMGVVIGKREVEQRGYLGLLSGDF